MMNTAYETQTGEALSIVDQVKGLSSTFAEDKQSSADQESELQAAFTALMEQKTTQLNTLISQRDQQQAVLTQVSQELEENRNAEATAKATLLVEQAYLTTIKAQEADTTAMYNQRMKDRTEEKKAVNMAMTVLNQENPSTTLLQRHASVRSKVHGRDLFPGMPACVRCQQASLFLRQRASQVHSELLATAAMATGSGQALGPVIGQLQELVGRLDEQQRAEEEHKEWCEHELSETAKTKAHHEMLVEEFKGKIEETKAEIAEKQQAIQDTADAIALADKEYTEMKDVREKAKADFEAELADYKDAIQAMNQAIDILADFYRNDAFMQGGVAADQVPVPGAADRAAVPEMATLTGGYVKKGGGHVVKILKTTREDFTAGQKNLKENEEKVMAATSYLAQVGGSCNMLIENFPQRTKMRAAEKESIQQAIGILQGAVF